VHNGSVANQVLGAAVAASVVLAATPYLARLSVTVPDRENPTWYRGATASRRIVLFTALTGLVLGGVAGAAGAWSALLPAFVAIALLGTPLTVIDYAHHRLPNRLVYPAAGAAVVLLALAAAVRHEWSDYLRAIEGGAATYVVLFVLMFISPKSFGWGDVRLGGVLGLYLGYHSWVAVYFGIFGGFVLGSLVALILLAAGRADRKTPIAFGPMLLLGALVVLAFHLTPTIGS
jgi:leader peptidase (prepilin peptidase)/N-methyltransferase